MPTDIPLTRIQSKRKGLGSFEAPQLKSHTAKTTKELQKLVKRKMRSMARDKNKVCGIFRRCEKASINLL